MGLAESIFSNHACAAARAAELCAIWDAMVDAIVGRMTEIATQELEPAHIHLRGEMALEIAQLTMMLTRKLVDDRLGRRAVGELTVEVEREECLGESGKSRIEATAQLVFEHV